MNLLRLVLRVKCPKKNLRLCLEEETYPLDAVVCHFFTQLSFSIQYLFSTSVNTGHKFKSAVTVFKNKTI